MDKEQRDTFDGLRRTFGYPPLTDSQAAMGVCWLPGEKPNPNAEPDPEPSNWLEGDERRSLPPENPGGPVILSRTVRPVLIPGDHAPDATFTPDPDDPDDEPSNFDE